VVFTGVLRSQKSCSGAFEAVEDKVMVGAFTTFAGGKRCAIRTFSQARHKWNCGRRDEEVLREQVEKENRSILERTEQRWKAAQLPSDLRLADQAESWMLEWNHPYGGTYQVRDCTLSGVTIDLFFSYPGLAGVSAGCRHHG
jgi:hypothetical protein